MKLFLTILSFTIFSANATIYYVSNAGLDANNGTSTSTSWQTISKVNAQTFSAGDQILFKSGDSWNEQLIVPSSGAVGNLITFGAYNTGLKPLITGFQTATGFTDSSHIWSTIISNSVKKQNCILINGIQAAKGRYPNLSQQIVTYPFGVPAGVLRANATDLYIAGGSYVTQNYVGGEIVAMSYAYIWDVAKITNQSADTLRFYPATTYNSGTDYFFIQNMVKVLDTLTEWAYDSTLKKIYTYSIVSPLMQYSTIDTLVRCKKDYINFNGLQFSGANKSAISTETLKYVTITNCNFNNIGLNAIEMNGAINCTITNDSMNNCQNDAIFTSQFCDTINILNNVIKNCGKSMGMGSNGNNAYLGIFSASNYANIKNNKIDSVGFNGISFLGNNVTVYQNAINYSSLVKADAGAIYTNYGGLPQTGSIIRSNIVTNTVGYYFQPSPRTACGIYVDNGSIGITIDSNTIYNAFAYGLLLNQNRSIAVHDNTIFNNTGGGITAPNGYTYNNINVTRNVFYQKNKQFPTIEVNYATDINGTVIEDSNYILRPDSVINQFVTQGVSYSYAGWNTTTGFDTHSSFVPAGVGTTVGVLYTNPSTSSNVFSLSGRYVDAKGIFYNNAITLQPFQSAILFYLPIQLLKSIGNLIFQ